MKKIYVFTALDGIFKEGNFERLTDNEKETIKRIGGILNEKVSRFDTKMWVASNLNSRYTSYYLRTELIYVGQHLEYKEDFYLDNEALTQDFVDMRLRKTTSSDNIIIADKDVCERLLKILVGIPELTKNCVYQIEYDEKENVFTYKEIIK